MNAILQDRPLPARLVPWPPAMHTTLGRCVLLAALLHLWLVIWVGTAPGGTAQLGQGVFGAINVTLRGPVTDGAAVVDLPPEPASTAPGDAPTPRWGGSVRTAKPLPGSAPGAASLGLPAARLPDVQVSPRPAEVPELPAPPPAPLLAPLPAPLPALPPAQSPPPALSPSPATSPATSLAPSPAPSLAPPPAPPPAPVPERPPVQPRLQQLPARPASPSLAPEAALPNTAPLAAPSPLPSLPAPQATVAAPVPQRQLASPLAAPRLAAPAPALSAGAAPLTLPELVAPESPGAAPRALRQLAPPAAAAARAPEAALGPSAQTPSATELPPAVSLTGQPLPALGTAAADAGSRVGHDVATPPAAPSSAPPRLNLELARPRGGPLSRYDTRGVLPVLPRLPERDEKLARDIEQAGKTDCRKAYSGMGPLAVIPLAVDALRKDGGCKW